MAKTLSIRKGDKVRIVAGKDKGKEGRVLRSDPASARVFIEGANMVKKHSRPSQRNPQGGILEYEGSVDVSNVMLVCPHCSETTRVGRIREKRVRQRVCKKCEKEIDG
jgi:large subunit ribosomal protein L24